VSNLCGINTNNVHLCGTVFTFTIQFMLYDIASIVKLPNMYPEISSCNRLKEKSSVVFLHVTGYIA
jgi:hypothetical protein